MKKKLLKKCVLFFIAFAMQGVIRAQSISDFENLNLSPESYWNGSDDPMGTFFSSGNAIFPNHYDTAWGGFWSTGWAYSNKTDTVTEGFMNIYSSFAGSGYNNSGNFAIGTQGSVIQLAGNAIGKAVAGLYVTNGTFAALSMKNGDMVGKPFGGSSGDDPDWFKLTVSAYYYGNLKDDSVEFYLADYRFADNALDYIVKSWVWVDLSSLGNVDSLIFNLSSSDNDPLWGMNTPAFFCIDNFTTLDSYASVSHNSPVKSMVFYPNPVQNQLHIIPANTAEDLHIEIYNSLGQTVLSVENQISHHKSLDLSSLKSGIYFLKAKQGHNIINHTFIKQ